MGRLQMDDAWAIEQTDPLLGWRIWRVRRLESLGDERPLRLAAVGRLGIPKFWEPRVPNRAVCSNYRTSHEAPWPTCRCGIYGFKERERAESALRRYARGDLSGWVLGRVSLWGRVVESQHGWRSQFAYPYELALYTRNRRLVRELRDVYAVDVTLAETPPRAARRSRASGPAASAAAEAGRPHDEWLRAWQESVAAALRVRLGESARVTIDDLSVSWKSEDEQT
jgi:hypothetical protein